MESHRRKKDESLPKKGGGGREGLLKEGDMADSPDAVRPTPIRPANIHILFQPFLPPALHAVPSLVLRRHLHHPGLWRLLLGVFFWRLSLFRRTSPEHFQPSIDVHPSESTSPRTSVPGSATSSVYAGESVLDASGADANRHRSRSQNFLVHRPPVGLFSPSRSKFRPSGHQPTAGRERWGRFFSWRAEAGLSV